MTQEKIVLAHGGGGVKTSRLIEEVFLKRFRDPLLRELDDGAVIGDRVFTTDSFVVRPLFFPGGDIGKLAVCGTVNDLAVMGAEPLYLSAAFILEEGFEIARLEQILDSISETAAACGARIVTGDTKVVEKGKGDGLYINTSGIGRLTFSRPVALSRIEPGDVVVINGPIGQHGLAVLAARADFGFSADIRSDVAPLWPFIGSFSGANVKFMRDPTRGGVAQTLNEIVSGKKFGIEIDEEEIPVEKEVRAFCEILGFDPMDLPNEGKVIVVVSHDDAPRLLEAMHRDPLGLAARAIGRITGSRPGQVILKTSLGTDRIVVAATGDLLPRIC
jgi:hydrogenase expression/formation protein HypE